MKKILPIILAVVMAACSDEKADTTGAPPERAIQSNYIVVKADTFRNEVVTTAEVIPFESVTLRAPLSGTVLNIYFKEGATVKEGDLLIRIDDRAWKSQLKGLEVEYESIEKELDRYKRLLDLDGASQQQVENAVARLAALQAQIEQLRVNIQLANVKAPFSGQVGLRNFSRGSYMNQGEEITALAQVDKLKVNFNLPEKYRPDVRNGDMVSLRVEGDTFPAEIYAIDPIINSDSRTVQARAFLNQPDKSVMPGVFAETILPTQVIQDAIILPSQVVVPEIEDQTIYVVSNGVAQRRVVEIAGRTSDMVLVSKGIQVGDTVITTGLMSVKDGSPVSLQQNISRK